MSVKKCPKCSSVWYSELEKCAFCGIEGVEQKVPNLAGTFLGAKKKAVAAPQPEPAREPAGVTTAEATPLPATRQDSVSAAPPTAASAAEVSAEKAPKADPVDAILEAPVSAPAPIREAPVEPTPVPVDVKTDDDETDRRVVEARPKMMHKPVLAAPIADELPSAPAPAVPSATVPLVFAILGVAACLLVPATFVLQHHRVGGILSLLACAVLSPFAPFGWFAGRRYEDRCRILRFAPAGLAVTGRRLAMLATMVLVLEGAAFAFYLAVMLLSSSTTQVWDIPWMRP